MHRQRISLKRISIMLALIFIAVCFVLVGSEDVRAAGTNVTQVKTHVYSPIAIEQDVRSGNFCADPEHPSDPRCQLASFAFRGAGEGVTKTDVQVREVGMTTAERDAYVKDKKLESYIMRMAAAKFRDHDTGANVTSFRVVSVSDINTISYLSPPKGTVESTVKLGITDKDSDLAIAFVETKVKLTYEKTDDKDDDSGKKGGKGGSKDEGDDGDEEYDDGDDEGIDDGGGDDDDAAAKKKEEEEKAKKKAEKEMMDKATAKITAKEREKEDNIAITNTGGGETEEGPDPLGIGLIALAAALAAAFGTAIRSDLRVMRWHKQKKALKGK